MKTSTRIAIWSRNQSLLAADPRQAPRQGGAGGPDRAHRGFDRGTLRGSRGVTGDSRPLRRRARAAGAARTPRARRPSRRDRRDMAAVGQRADLPRSVGRDDDPEQPGAQAPGLRPVRRRGRGGDHLPSRGGRRRAQLGLPLLVGPGLGVHPRRLPASGVRCRGEGLLLVADARLAAEPPAPSGALPARRWRSRARAGALACRLSRLAPGAGRKRRRHSTSARYLRRASADRLALRGCGTAPGP